jgi:hypothetical protein
MLTFKCSACRKKIVTDDHLCGQQGECPYCRKVITAPGTPRDEGGGAHRGDPRCPKCGARRKDASSTCAFCGAQMGPPKTRRMEVPVSEGVDRRKVMLLGGLVAAALIVAYFAFGSSGNSVPKLSDDEQCRRQMMSMLDNMWVAGVPPQVQGSQFWIDVANKQNVQGLIKCPSAGKGRRCDYRGPGKPMAELHDPDVVMVCMVGNHPGGVNVLTRNGVVSWAPDNSDLFKKALNDSKE